MAKVTIFSKYTAFRLYKEVFAYYRHDAIVFPLSTNKDPEVERS